MSETTRRDVPVVLCRCGHAERMHERDELAEGGRGACRHGACGCSEFRAGEPVDVQPAPVAPAATARPDPAPKAEPKKARTWSCDEIGCDSGPFDSPQGLGAHRRHAHPKGTPAATIVRPAQPAETAEPAPVATSTVAPAPRPAAAGMARYGMTLDVQFTDDRGGRAHLELTDGSRAELDDFLDIIARFIQAPPTERTAR
jgi:hypothetical protein